LGPDILSASFDAGEVARRVRAAGEREIGDVVLDQRVIAGIGNIYKSEGLFLARIEPRRPAREVTTRELARLWKTLAPLMHEGTRRVGAIATLPPSVSAGGERNWVYRRRTRPCFVCGTLIEMVRQGELRRATYYCPHCQR
jgi:formamidopyrimidine-DNA glycosylase